MADPLDYAAYQVASSPPWQQLDDLSIGWNEALGLLKDAYAGAIRLAVKVRFPDFCPSDALDALGWTFQIDRSFIFSDVAYRAALKNAWVTWEQAGTVPGMTAVLTQAGFANVAIWEAWYWSDGNPTYYFTVTCSLPMPWDSYPLADGTWGDGDASKTWGDGDVWASGIPAELRAELRALINKWKPLHTACAAVIVTLNTGSLWDVTVDTWDDGSTWTDLGTALFIAMDV